MNYFKKPFFFGAMFHHFYDLKKHKRSQGSINKSQFYKIIKFIGKKNILDADEFYNRYKEGKLKKNNVCITFDDGLKCQVDIALPVLEDLRIKSFFFIYSSPLEKKPHLLEVHRYFRTYFFKSPEEFYNLFFDLINEDLSDFFKKKKKNISQIMKQSPFYSISDIKFRLGRDYYLGKDKYNNLMKLMFKEKKFEPKLYFKKLFMSNNDKINLNKLGHKIGLHSHSHPTAIEKLNFNEQFNEYSLNQKLLSKLLKLEKNEIKFMSHPCGKYNTNSLKILNKIGIELGFRADSISKHNNKIKTINNSKFELARIDHTIILKKMINK